MKHRNKYGRFRNKPVWRRKDPIVLSIMAGIVLGILIDVAVTQTTTIEYVKDVHAEEIVEELPVVLLEEDIEWTTERIKEAIREAFPEEPERMVLVAKCESDFRHWINNPATNDHGLFQLNERWHGAELKRLGLDPYDVEDNIAYARILYDKNHLRDWNASKHCWNR